MDYLNGYGSSDLNGVLSNMGMRNMLEGSEQQGFDIIVLFVAWSIDGATELFRNAPITGVYCRTSKLRMK